MRKQMVFGVIMVALVLGPVLAYAGSAVQASEPARGGISYASRPDEAALYLNDMVFVRDTVTLPAEDVRVLLPPGTYPDTLILRENGDRVRSYRVAPQGSDVYYSQAAFRYDTSMSYGGGMAYALFWDMPESAGDTRTITLEYMMAGAHWTPTYDMEINDTTSVDLAFFAEIQNTSLMLDSARVFLVAGRVDLSQQVDQVAQITMNQYAVGYSNEVVDLPALGVGSVDLQHIYVLDDISAEPGDVVYTSIIDATLEARRLLVWDAAAKQEVDVIYKVLNSAEVPLAQGIVRSYQDGVFLGSDYIETTPLNSEGSVTVGSLPDVRVRRTASEEYNGGVSDYYLHTVTMEISNFGEDAIDLVVLDRWLDEAWQFEFSLEAERQPDNLLRWEVAVPAGESLTITYTFRTEY